MKRRYTISKKVRARIEKQRGEGHPQYKQIKLDAKVKKYFNT